MAFEWLAFVHKEHGHRAGAGWDAGQVFAGVHGADGGDDLQAVTAEDWHGRKSGLHAPRHRD